MQNNPSLQKNHSHACSQTLKPRSLAALLLAAACAAGSLVPADASARDLSLAQAEALVALANREVIAARRAVESAGAGIQQAGARPNPVVSYGASSLSANPGIGAGSLVQKRIDNVFRVDQVFERGDKRQLRIDAALGLERAAIGDSADVLRLQLLAARVAYADLQYSQARLGILAETGELFGRTLAAAQTRLKAGDLAASEVSRIQVDHERAQSDVRSAQADVSRTQLALAYLVGDASGVLPSVTRCILHEILFVSIIS